MKELLCNGDVVNNDMAWIYSFYGFECIYPQMVRDTINELEEGEELKIVINSGGGDVFAGQEIFSVLKDIKNPVTVEIQSIAASAASMIAMAGDKVKISPVALIMIHNASTSASGDYREMEHTAEVLKKINDAIMASYGWKTGKTEDELLELMNNETWLTAKECVEHGFADEILTEKESPITAAIGSGLRVTEAMAEHARAEMKKKEDMEKEMEKEINNILGDLDFFGV